MKKYELLLVLPGTLDDKEVASRAEEILTLVKGLGDDAELSAIGKNRLAYAIRQIRYGYFYTIVFSTDNDRLKVLHDKLALLRDVLRAMITHFHTPLTASQKVAYSAESAGPVPVVERVFVPAEEKRVAPVMAEAVAPRKVEKLDLAEINKKLDDLMSGDVVPGV